LVLTGMLPDYLTNQGNFYISEYFKPYEVYPGITLNYTLAEPIIVRPNGVLELNLDFEA